MASKKNTVSIYVDDDLLKKLNEFKTNGEFKSLNEALNSYLKKGFGGGVSGNAQSNGQSNLDIEAMVNATVESRLESVLNQVEQFRLDVSSLKTGDLLYENLRTNLTVAQQRLEALEATVGAKKPHNAIPESKGDSNPEITGNSLEPDSLPIIEAIANITAPSIENPLPDESLSVAIAATARAKNITYRLNRDGSVVLGSLVGTSIKVLKKMSDAELKAIGIFRTLIGADEKFFPIDPDAIASTTNPKLTKMQSTKVDTGKRFTSMAAAAYYRQKTGQPLKETTLITNAKKYGFVIKEKGSGLYALIDES